MRRLIVGINECLVGYDLLAGAAFFSYRMPLVFQEFVEVGNPLIVRDVVERFYDKLADSYLVFASLAYAFGNTAYCLVMGRSNAKRNPR
ncbi:hypothetical protein [Paraburkholderia diazotrophica]|uniref:hypothetical protein n=1 Tax=Paraburkholderia diazotrophica TaxID=667676 RepID=UPI000B85D2C0|nr:hypothetical protein [Paraburkholderia diazotrophica]